MATRHGIILADLKKKLTLKDPGFFGCQRRNRYAREEGEVRVHSSTALLELLATRESLTTPAGELEYFIYLDNWLVTFRGGQWNSKWIPGVLDLWALVRTYSDRPEVAWEVVVVSEYQGDLEVHKVDVPREWGKRAQARAEALVSGLMADPPARIPKNTKMAHRVCRYCSYRVACNAQDALLNDTSDWSESYRKELGS